MADNRQFTDHNEIGGVNVYLEDKKLAESPEKNTVESTDYVLLKNTEGVPQKISKANLMGVVKDALADLLKSNDLGTSVTNVPALNASAFGSATVANLASVLGGSYVNFATGDQPPGTTYGTLQKFTNPNKVSMRTFIDHINNFIYFNATNTEGDSLTGWKGTPLVSNIGELASALGVYVFKGRIIGTVNTGIKVAGYEMGKTLIIIGSLNGGDGDQTASYIKMIRCPYNGTTIEVSTIIENYKDAYTHGLIINDISVNGNGDLILKDDSDCNYVTIISNR